MAPASKANYKTYEAQARMIRAIVAAHPEVKWNYKEIVACYGSDMTDHALNHRFRRIRAQVVVVHEGRKHGLDLMDMNPVDTLPGTQEGVDKKNIAKYFGQSTPDGIQFQFRGIKKDADTLRQVAQQKGDTASCLSLGSASSLPATPIKSTSTKNPGSSQRNGSAHRPSASKRVLKRDFRDDENMEEDEEEEEFPSDLDGLEDPVPNKRAKHSGETNVTPVQKTGTPRRAAARAADDTIAAATLHLGDSDSSLEDIQQLSRGRKSPLGSSNGYSAIPTNGQSPHKSIIGNGTLQAPLPSRPIKSEPVETHFNNNSRSLFGNGGRFASPDEPDDQI